MSAHPPPTKIKGGKRTVIRFFLVSVAYTSVWIAVSSQLDYFKTLYGPSILLKLNIAYYLPTIPLLILSSFLDAFLDRKLGTACTMLWRLLLGLTGYGLICVTLPRSLGTEPSLLAAVVGLGLFGGLAFSASYQLVARFANKNVIALGLGCSASGPLVLLLELAAHVGPMPSFASLTTLYASIAALVLAGLVATVSLLLRHWDAVELQSRMAAEQHPACCDHADKGAHAPMLSDLEAVPQRTLCSVPSSSLPVPAVSASARARSAAAHPGALEALLSFPHIEPLNSYVSADDGLLGRSLRAASATSGRAGSLTAARRFATDDGVASWRGSGGSRRAESLAGSSPRQEAELLFGERPRPLDSPQKALQKAPLAASPLAPRLSPHELAAGGGAFAGGGPGEFGEPALAAAQLLQEASEAFLDASELDASTRALLLQIWPLMLSIFLSTGVALTLFPFFTYVPSSGLLGDAFPRALFFARIFGDVLGRVLPRLRALHCLDPRKVLLGAAAKLALAPLFFLYLDAAPELRRDALALAYVAGIWVLGGWINTSANMLGPALVPIERKGAAAGTMAISYQAAHVVGLSAATALSLLKFGTLHS